MEDMDSVSIGNVVEETIAGIERGKKKKKYKLSSSVDFDLAVTVNNKVDGGVDVGVADIKGKYDTKAVSRVKFSVIPEKSMSIGKGKILEDAAF